MSVYLNPKPCIGLFRKRRICGLVIGLCSMVILLLIHFTTDNRPQAPVTRFNTIKTRFQKQMNHRIPQPMSSLRQNRTANYLPDTLQELEKRLQELEKQIESQLDVKKTKIVLIGTKTLFSLGDIVELRIILHKQDGSPRLTGGDGLRVRLYEERLNASASGRVVDHGNGSYTAVVKCLWTGSPLISVYPSSMAEIDSFLQMYTSTIPARITNAVYNNGETGVCHPLRKWLTTSRGICNMTSRNGDMSWYCERPKSGKQSCDDFKHYGGEQNSTHEHRRVSKLFSEKTKDTCYTLQITVKDKTKFAEPLKLPCSRYNRTKLWTLPSPVGYFYQNQWKLLHCTPPPSGKITDCLRHKHFVMYGDSTVRQWFVEINRTFECTLLTEKWTHPKWRLNSRIYCRHTNLTVDLIFHAQPNVYDNKTVTYESVSKHLLNFYKCTDVIFLIGVQAHFNEYEHSIYRDRIEHIARSVGKILEGNPDSKILVKGGHTSWNMRRYNSDLFRNIVTHEFVEVLDRVIYLDNMDITMSKLIKKGHPPADIVSVMVNHMLGYVCN